jgi:hypothetical protein
VDCSGVDAPAKYDVDEDLHEADRNRADVSGQPDPAHLTAADPA